MSQQLGDMLLREAHAAPVEEKIVLMFLFISLHSDFTVANHGKSARRENLNRIRILVDN
jgi:hypothetical protein